MEVKIYQLKNIEDCKYAFSTWKYAKKKFSLNDYKEVYDELLVVKPSISNNYSLLMTENEKYQFLERLYTRFNINTPSDFTGHSLSVSDVVALGDELYYCDVMGWTKIGE